MIFKGILFSKWQWMTMPVPELREIYKNANS
jgi:hypothetical protein